MTPGLARMCPSSGDDIRPHHQERQQAERLNPRTALNGPTVGSHFLRVEAIIGLPSICRPRGVGPGGRRGAKERITI